MFWLKRIGGNLKPKSVRIPDVGLHEITNGYIFVKNREHASYLTSPLGENATKMRFVMVDEKDVLNFKEDAKVEIPVNTFKREKIRMNPNRNVLIVTAFTKGYDALAEHLQPISNYHYLCYTNDYNYKSDFFVIAMLPETEIHSENVRLARNVKLNLNSLISIKDYDYIVWLDANCCFKREIDTLIDDLGDDEIAIFGHRERDCMYDEAKACILYKKDSPDIINKQVAKYKKGGFPEHYGMWATHCIVYKPTNDVLDFFKIWHKEIVKHSYRDQISLPYALRKTNVKFHTLLNTEIFSQEWFKYLSIRGHGV